MIIDAALDLFRILRLGISSPRANVWSNLEVFWIAFIHSRPIDISYHQLFVRAIGPDYSCTGMRRLGLSRSQMLLSCRRPPADDLYSREGKGRHDRNGSNCSCV